MPLVQLNWKPSAETARWFGAILLALAGILGLAIRWRTGADSIAAGIWAAGASLAFLYYAVRPLRRPLYVVFTALLFPIGWTVSHVAAAALYYLVLTPIGLCLRLAGHDPLRRSFEQGAPTYWVERRASGDASRYFRQY